MKATGNAHAQIVQTLPSYRETGAPVQVSTRTYTFRAGNTPPWMLPARGRYSTGDSLRVAARVGLPDTRFPPNFMAMSNSLVPLRALHYIRANYPTPTFLATMGYLFHVFFTPPHLNISKAESLAEILKSCPAGFIGAGAGAGSGSEKLFTESEVGAIMEGAAGEEMKDSVKRETDEVLAKGAFGAPWLCVRNDEGKEDVFFGSDRFVYVYEHLGLPIQRLEILPAGAGQGSSRL